MKYKCVIFDCDGVLVDSETISAKELINMAQELGVVFDMPFDDAVVKFSGVSLQFSFNYIEEKLGKPLPESFEKDFRHRTFQKFKSHLKPIEGIHDLIEGLSCEYCVASSGPHEKINLNLSLTGLYDKFEGRIFSSYDINSWKPEPGIFLYAAKKMGFAPEDCAVIEDSISGVAAAVKGGFDVYGYANTYNESRLQQEGAHIFHTMKSLSDILQ